MGVEGLAAVRAGDGPRHHMHPVLLYGDSLGDGELWHSVQERSFPTERGTGSLCMGQG